MTNKDRDEMQHLIDCAYDCDEPALAEERKALLIAMGLGCSVCRRKYGR